MDSGAVMRRGRRTWRRLFGALLAGLLAWAAGPASAGGDGAPAVIVEISDEFAWGYQSGLKQPLGAYRDGLSLHPVSRSNYPQSKFGNPDHIFWVNEADGTSGIRRHPGGYTDYTKNPGSMLGFDRRGHVWYTIGGRAQHMPPDLFRSLRPMGLECEKVIEDFARCWQCTVPTMQIVDPPLVLMWRHGHSTNATTTVRFRRFHKDRLDKVELERDLGIGVMDPVMGEIGIEQFWTRYDPRFRVLMLTWQWYEVKSRRFGSNPFLFTDDVGDTWRTADGRPVERFPISYADRTPELVPFDHLGRGEHNAWQHRDIGIAPDRTFWMTLPKGNARVSKGWSVMHWLFADGRWQGRELTGGMLERSKPHATGATRDFLVFLYSEYDDNHVLKVRVSRDGGRTWDAPRVLDEVDAGTRISWVSFIQPSEDYEDNEARFIYGYYRKEGGPFARKFKNRIRWVKVDADRVGELPPAPGGSPVGGDQAVSNE